MLRPCPVHSSFFHPCLVAHPSSLPTHPIAKKPAGFSECELAFLEEFAGAPDICPASPVGDRSNQTFDHAGEPKAGCHTSMFFTSPLPNMRCDMPSTPLSFSKAACDPSAHGLSDCQASLKGQGPAMMAAAKLASAHKSWALGSGLAWAAHVPSPDFYAGFSADAYDAYVQ